MEFVVDKLVDYSSSKDEELRDIAGLGEPSIPPGCIAGCYNCISFIALKTMTAELPQESNLAPSTCTKLIPKLLNQLQNVC